MASKSNTRSFISLNIAVLTMSDTRTINDDKSGDLLVQRLSDADHRLAGRQMSRDDIGSIRKIAKAWIDDPKIDVILSTGGTGFTGRDVTLEAMEPLFEKRMDGFSVIFHQISHGKIGTSTIQSRATGGVANSTYIFCLPGSPGACKDAWDEIISHQLDYRHLPCNFVEIMPRLGEGLKRSK